MEAKRVTSRLYTSAARLVLWILYLLPCKHEEIPCQHFPDGNLPMSIGGLADPPQSSALVVSPALLHPRRLPEYPPDDEAGVSMNLNTGHLRLSPTPSQSQQQGLVGNTS
jgi:hypothetical protein